MGFSHTEPVELTITDIKRPTRPQFEFRNPLKDDIFVNGIELILTPEFSSKGAIIARVNREVVFDSSQKSIEGYAKYPISVNKEFMRNKTIEIFAWNKIDSNTLKFTGNISISDESQLFQSQAVPMGRDVFNKVVNDAENVFDFLEYEDETITKLIDTVGKQNMIIIIASANPLIPTITNPSSWTNPNNAIDVNLTTSAINLNQILDSEFLSTGILRTMSFDFGQALGRKVGYKASIQSGTITSLTGTLKVTLKILESEDDLSYTELDSVSQTITTTGGNLLINIESSKEPNPLSRYFKIETSVDISPVSFVANNANMSVNELYDFNRAFGTAELSFEVLEENTQQWIEYIKAVDIGTITKGEAITKQVGSTTTDDPLTGKFNKFIPSTQTSFRAKLTITGALQTAVSIIAGG